MGPSQSPPPMMGGREEEGQPALASGGLALYQLVVCDSFITCCAWDTATSAGAGAGAGAFLPAHADVADGMALALADVAGAAAGMHAGLPAPTAAPSNMALADVAMCPIDDGAPAPADMALDAPDSSAQRAELDVPQRAQQAAGWRGMHSVALVFGCEDGTLWRAEIAWPPGWQGRPASRLHLCFEGVSVKLK
jgi:hypothetical protein